jgi:hypothetical protein
MHGTLHQSAPWWALLQHAKREGLLYQESRPYSEPLSSESARSSLARVRVMPCVYRMQFRCTQLQLQGVHALHYHLLIRGVLP